MRNPSVWAQEQLRDNNCTQTAANFLYSLAEGKITNLKFSHKFTQPINLLSTKLLLQAYFWKKRMKIPMIAVNLKKMLFLDQGATISVTLILTKPRIPDLLMSAF